MSEPNPFGWPLILAGPFLRRSDPREVNVWIATRSEQTITGEIYRMDELLETGRRRAIGRGEQRSIFLGSGLKVSLIRIRPLEGEFPTDALLGYDLFLERRWLSKTVAMRGPNGLAYQDLPLPSFVLRSGSDLDILHASCRKPHGDGGFDALAVADRMLDVGAHRFDQRPGALFLTGDQIYADDVARVLTQRISQIAYSLMGWDELLPRGDGSYSPLSSFPFGSREKYLRQLGFSSGYAKNHLMGFGEYAAMYLLAWNPGSWPALLLGALQGGFKDARTDAEEYASVLAFRATLPMVRRVLANVPTYMVLDDHEVTDDWNVNGKWRDATHGNALSRRVIANGLGTFWAFQGWGNDPVHFGEGRFRSLSESLATRFRSPAEFETPLLDQLWAFEAPTSPVTVCLDTRTHRSFDRPDSAPRLLGSTESPAFAVVRRAAERAKEAGQPLVVVSPVPVIGFPILEHLQTGLWHLRGAAAADYEAWSAHAVAFHELLSELRGFDLPGCVFLSGDVHYSFVMTADFKPDAEAAATRFVQFTSSALKNSAGAKVGVARAVSARHRDLRVWLPGTERYRRVERTWRVSRETPVEAAFRPAPEQDIKIRAADVRSLQIRDRPDYSLSLMLEDGRVITASNLGRLQLDGANAIMDHHYIERGRPIQARSAVQLRGSARGGPLGTP